MDREGVYKLIDGEQYSYSLQIGSNYELGQGIYTASTATLSRQIQDSSYNGRPIPVPAGSVLSITPLASDLTGALVGIPDAPLDGRAYNRQNGAWVAAQGFSNGVPIIRSRLVLEAAASSFTVPLPQNASVGDFAVIIAATPYAISTLTGWSQIDNQTGTGIGGAVFAKVLTQADITAGAVTIGVTNAQQTIIGIIVVPGALSVRTAAITRSTAGASVGIKNTTDGSPRYGDLAIAFALSLGTDGALRTSFGLLVDFLFDGVGCVAAISQGPVYNDGAVSAWAYGDGGVSIQSSYSGVLILQGPASTGEMKPLQDTNGLLLGYIA
jgi:hypothetical protein